MKDRKPIPVDLTRLNVKRFWKNIKVGGKDECWEWQGVKRKNGGKQGRYTTHRVAWVLAYGQIPSDKPYVYQTCHNKYCCNPMHLTVGTQSDYGNIYQRLTCTRGEHPWVPGNIYIDSKTGHKRCRPCRLESRRAPGTPPRRIITCDVQSNIAERYQTGEKSLALAKEYGISQGSVKRILALLDVPRRGKTGPKVVGLDEAAIVKSYAMGISMHSIAKELGVNWHIIRKRLIGNGVKLRYWPRPERTILTMTTDSRRFYDVDEAFFDTLTEESAYVIGFIQADGNIFGSRLVVALKSSDIELLRTLSKCMKSTAPIKITASGRGYSKSECARLEVYSARIVNAMRKWDIHEHKSHTASTHPDLLLNRDYWRGVIDGDGCLSIDRRWGGRSLALVGSKSMCEEFLAFGRHYGCGKYVHVHKHKTIFSVCFSGFEAERIAYILYNRANIALERKKLIYEKYFSNYNFDDFESCQEELRHLSKTQQILDAASSHQIMNKEVLLSKCKVAAQKAIKSGLSAAEIANLLNISVPSVRKYLGVGYKLRGRGSRRRTIAKA